MSKRKENIFNEYNQEYSSYQQWKKLCSEPDSYTMPAPKDFSGLLPSNFLEKTNEVVLMEKETAGSSVFVANFNRIDANSSGSQIDQHPYIVAFDHSGSKCKGGFLDHGDWRNRTVTFDDPELWTIISGSGLLNHLPFAQFPEKQSGSIEELEVISQNEAFSTSLKLLENKS